MPKRSVKRKAPVSKKTVSNYTRDWLKWVVVYFLLGSLVYLSVYALFFQKGFSDYKPQTTQSNP